MMRDGFMSMVSSQLRGSHFESTVTMKENLPKESKIKLKSKCQNICTIVSKSGVAILQTKGPILQATKKIWRLNNFFIVLEYILATY